jgi:hypothetical protein
MFSTSRAILSCWAKKSRLPSMVWIIASARLISSSNALSREANCARRWRYSPS